MAATASVPELALVKDVLHCCQGIDGGRYIWLQGDDDTLGRFVCGSGVDIPAAQQQLISKITELGWLLRKVKELAHRAAALGSVEHEALMAACNKEVNNCYRLIAILEAQIQAQPPPSNPPPTTPTDSVGQLSLRRLAVWLAEPQQRLRVLTGCLEAALPLRGGQVINALHAMSKHGDPLVRRTVAPLLEEACVPFFKRVARWVLDGTLGSDPSPSAATADFMIADTHAPSDRLAAVWGGKYVLDVAMKPRFISDELAEQVLTAGKTVAFLRERCGDSEWAAAMAGQSAPSLDNNSSSDGGGGAAHHLRWLHSAVTDVRATVGGRLLDIVIRRERLPAHLSAVRKYVLMGQGDFVRTLIDLAVADLDRPAKDLSVFALQGHVESALRSCGAAAADADLLHHVQVKLNRPLDGDTGWDVFALTYGVEGPASVVLSPDAMSVYGRVSRLLWNIKQADHVVARAWHLLDGVGHSLAALRALEKEHGIDAAAVAGNVPALLRYLHAQRADMSQFVASLQAKVVYEVIEPAWGSIEAELAAAGDLDAAIQAHSQGLAAISEGTFLDGAPGGEGGSAGGRGSASEVHAALRAALRAVLDIHGPIRRLTDAVEAAVVEQRAFLKRVRESEAVGEWNEEVYNSPPGVSRDLLVEVRSGAWRVHSAFDRHVRTFHSLVPQHSHFDLRTAWLSSSRSEASTEVGGLPPRD